MSEIVSNELAEAKKRIEELEAENARLRGQCEKYHWLLTRCAEFIGDLEGTPEGSDLYSMLEDVL